MKGRLRRKAEEEEVPFKQTDCVLLSMIELGKGKISLARMWQREEAAKGRRRLISFREHAAGI